MTALAAHWSLSDAGDGAGACRRMLAGQSIYGQDDAQRSLGPVTLGRRLWTITDEDERDRGPVTGGDGTLLMVADLRIDNRDEMAAALGWGAADRRAASDPAMAMALVERFGAEGLARIVGPFALVLWDARAGTMTLARDVLGERPLFFHRGDGFVAAASMPAGLHALPGVDYAADLGTAAEFLALLPEAEPTSFFAGIERVLPGHLVTIDRTGAVRARRYWEPGAGTLRLRDGAAYAEALRDEFDRAVACRLARARGGVATQLSGGLDSGAVAATAARLLAPETLHAFTAVPSIDTPARRGRFGDEGPHAAAVAAMHPNIAHHLIRASATSPLSLMDRQFRLFQRPVFNPCNQVWLEAISDGARARGASVLLTGQMGNFTISHEGLQRLPQLLRGGRWIALARLARTLHRHGRRWRGIGALTLGPFLPYGLWQRVGARVGDELAAYSAIAPAAAGGLEQRGIARGDRRLRQPFADSRAARLWALQRVDLGVFNKGTLAGWGLDVRDPTCDRRLIEWALSVPEEQWILDGVPRSLARRAFADRLPAAVLDERRKGLQGADWYLGMGAALGSLREELDSLDRSADARGLIDIDRLRNSVDSWPAGGLDSEAADLAYRSALLRGVAAGHFLRKVARTN